MSAELEQHFLSAAARTAVFKQSALAIPEHTHSRPATQGEVQPETAEATPGRSSDTLPTREGIGRGGAARPRSRVCPGPARRPPPVSGTRSYSEQRHMAVQKDEELFEQMLFESVANVTRF